MEKKNLIFLQLRMFKVSSQPLEGYLHIFLMVNNLQFFKKTEQFSFIFTQKIPNILFPQFFCQLVCVVIA